MVLLEGVLHVEVNFTGHSPRKGRVLNFYSLSWKGQF